MKGIRFSSSILDKSLFSKLDRLYGDYYEEMNWDKTQERLNRMQGFMINMHRDWK